MIKCILPKAFYSEEDLSHYGIGISNYTHWTSPIRRAADLIDDKNYFTVQIPISKNFTFAELTSA